MSDRTSNALSDRRVTADRQRKFAFPPDGAPMVVVLTGQAAMCGQDAWSWVALHFDEETVSGRATLTTPRDVARSACRVMDFIVRRDIGVEGFVAGFGVGVEPGHGPHSGEVWTFGVDDDCAIGPRDESGLGGDVYG
jgi:hypothetical protein